MTNILIINGHQKTPTAHGKLTRTLIQTMKEVLSQNKDIHIKVSTLQKGWDIKKEQAKFMWADTIIYQYPIYWFHAPALLQKYLQEVLEYGVFYGVPNMPYGKGGKLANKTYMLSTTWNSPLDAFGQGFWQGIPSPDDALIAMHKAQQFIGLKPLPSFSCHNVIKNPEIQEYINGLKHHLRLVFLK